MPKEFITLVKNNDTAGVRQYLSAHQQDLSINALFSLHFRGKQQVSVLHLAAINNNPEMVTELLRYPSIDPNLLSNSTKGPTALGWACVLGYVGVAQVLISDPRVDVMLSDSQGNTPFARACFSGYIDLVCLFLNGSKSDKVKIDQPADDGKTPLWCAARGGHADIVQELICFADVKRLRLDVKAKSKLGDGTAGSEHTDCLEAAQLLAGKTNAKGLAESARLVVQLLNEYHKVLENAS